jgi:hypothetical protein
MQRSAHIVQKRVLSVGVGVRFGVQALGFLRIDELRFIWEIGGGAW